MDGDALESINDAKPFAIIAIARIHRRSLALICEVVQHILGGAEIAEMMMVEYDADKAYEG